MKTAMAEVELRAEKGVEYADVGAHDGNGRRHGGSVGEAFGKDLVEVIAHFGFEQDGFVNLEGETRACAGEVRFCLREMKIVGINAGLNVIVLGERSRRERNDA